MSVNLMLVIMPHCSENCACWMKMLVSPQDLFKTQLTDWLLMFPAPDLFVEMAPYSQIRALSFVGTMLLLLIQGGWPNLQKTQSRLLKTRNIFLSLVGKTTFIYGAWCENQNPCAPLTLSCPYLSCIYRCTRAKFIESVMRVDLLMLNECEVSV